MNRILNYNLYRALKGQKMHVGNFKNAFLNNYLLFMSDFSAAAEDGKIIIKI